MSGAFEASGKYRLDVRLGGGGMAEVFVGAQLGAEGFARKVAIKRILPGFSDNPAFAQMFVDEARISSRLVHPHIVSVHDFDRDLERRLFLVMELVEGKDLDSLVQSGGVLPMPVVIYVIGCVLRGLGHAHDLPVNSDIRGVVHRDVSPHNVLLSWEGAVKVSDFGIAKARAASEATASVFIKGKPAYMSPEQANGDALDGRSDLFAVGIMLWEMLIGRRLFTGEDTRATLAAVLFGQIPKPRSLRPDVPKDLDRVVMKLLERDLPARYRTAETALRDLLACEVAQGATTEALADCLRDRFPGVAPARHSSMRGRGATPTADPASPTAPTMASMSPTGAAAAPTAWKEPTTTGRRAKRIAAAAAVSLIGGGIGVAVVAGLSGSGGKTGSGAAVLPLVDARPVDARPDTSAPQPPPPPPPPPPAPLDAGSPPSDGKSVDSKPPPSQKDAQTGDSEHAAPGTLNVKCFPIAKLTIDGVYRGETPMKGIQLSAGKHTVRVDNDDANIHTARPVVVVANQTIEINLSPP